MSFFRHIGLLAHTIAHLKAEQIGYRLYYRLRGTPRPDCRPAPPLAQRAPRAPFCAMPEILTRENSFRFLNVSHQVTDPADWNHTQWGKLWLYNLHYFDFLRQPGLPATCGNAWIDRWIADNPPCRGNGWEPYVLSLRIANWIKWHLAGNPLSEKAIQSLAVQIRALEKQKERHLLANHYLANAKAFVFAGLFFTGCEAKRWLDAGEAIYRRELPEQILADGGHFERSAMYHSIILEDLLDLVNLGSSLPLAPYIEKMVAFLAAMTAPDGKIVAFNDAAYGIAVAPENLFRYAQSLGFAAPAPVVASCDFPATGYARLQANKWTLLCDGAEIGPDYQPGHAHADTLTFDLWHDKTHLVVDSGTGEYIDTLRRKYQRGTPGHNTATIDGKNSSAVWSAHRVARRAHIVERHFAPDEFTAAHDGYCGVIHFRTWRIDADGIKITDRFTGRGMHTIDLFWHFPPQAKIRLEKKAARVELDGKCFCLTLPVDARSTVGTGHFSPEFGTDFPAPVLKVMQERELPWETTTEIKESSAS